MTEEYNEHSPAVEDTEAEQETVTEESTETTTEEAAIPASPVTISADNPNKEDMAALCESIKVDYNFDVDVKGTVFNFKKSKDKDTGIETIREAVHLAVPYPSVDGILAILENKDESGEVREGANKGLELLLDAMGDVVNAQARDLLYEDLNLNAGTFPIDKLSWEFIANIPKVQRRGSGIPKETWEAFGIDYCAIMPDATGKNLDQVTKASRILLNKFSQVRTAIPILELMQQQLAIYVEHSPNIEEFQDCVEFLAEKAEIYLNVKPEELLASL